MNTLKPRNMVSTRGIRYKFSEGERVLCYEPDPTKAKVLYDSKVLEVIESKDKRGRRTVEYLIHFQGWNSSWDRCVSEDFVLKDTEENRQLQRDLAEKSQLQLGAYLYRRERKKPAAGAPAKRPRQGFSDDGSSTSTQPDEVEAETAGDTDSSLCSSGSQLSSPPPQPQPGRAHINLPSLLRNRLTFDYHLIVKRGRLSSLPVSPSVADILESFVKWFARSGAWRPVRPARPEPPHKPDLLDVCCRLNLVREVADGLRVYFDFVLKGHLLYKQELEQYHEHCGQYIIEPEEEIKSEVDECEEEDEEETPQPEEYTAAEEEMKSPRIPEYAHLPPDPEDPRNNVAGSSEPPPPEPPKLSPPEKLEPEEKQSIEKPSGNESDGAKVKEDVMPRRTCPVARRLRSHKSAVSQSENEEPAPSTSAAGGDPKTVETLSSSVCSSESSVSSGWTGRANAAPQASAPRSPTQLSQLLEKVAKWQIIPREGTEHLPCRVYGATHLARLFVKLPEFLNATQMPDMKLKLVLKYIDMFVQYLDEHSEWFGEMIE